MKKQLIVVILLATTIFTLALSPVSQGLKRVADFYFDVASGDVRGHSSVNKFGRNIDVDSAAVEDIWDGGGVWNEPSASQVYTFTSTSAADTSAGAGARTMEIFGLDSAGALQNETLTLNGTAWITAANSYQMIHRMIVRTVGVTGTNVGVITANANTDETVTAQINAGNNQTLMAIYKIPAANDGCVVNFYNSILRSGGPTTAADIILYAKPTSEGWQVKHINGLMTGGTSQINHRYGVPNCFEPLTLLKMSAGTTADNIDVSAGFDLVLHPN
jgi:hypothetical protein